MNEPTFNNIVINPAYLPASEALTLRDYFANSYMQGVMSSGDSLPDYKYVAECSYKMADAMMEARKQGGE